MNNLPREMLVRIVAKYGRSVGDDARRCEGLLNDLCGEYRREINVLVNAVDERIPLDLLAASGTTPHELLLTRLEKRFENQTGLTIEAARWAVESWALALGAATSAQIAERERNHSAESLPKTETVEPLHPENKPPPTAPNINRPNPPAAPKIQKPLPPIQNAPPQSRQPPVNPLPPSAAPAHLPVNRQPQAQTSASKQPTQPAQPAIPAKRGFGIFRGCFLIVFLIALAAAALFFVAPYAIETMRETQRERNNEPPRFPVR